MELGLGAVTDVDYICIYIYIVMCVYVYIYIHTHTPYVPRAGYTSNCQTAFKILTGKVE